MQVVWGQADAGTGRRRPPPDHGGDRHHVPGKTHAAAYGMHAKEA